MLKSELATVRKEGSARVLALEEELAGLRADKLRCAFFTSLCRSRCFLSLIAAYPEIPSHAGTRTSRRC